METKIVSIKPTTPQALRAVVNFLDGDQVVLDRSYDFSVDAAIESIYSQIKEDLTNLEKGKRLVASLGDTMNKAVDLTDVKSTSELKAEAALAAKETVVESPEDPSKPLG